MAELKTITVKGTVKEKFNIDDENGNRLGIIELDIKDTNIVLRLNECQKKIESIIKKFEAVNDDTNLNALAEIKNNVDNELNSIIDYVFDSPIAEIISGGKSMIDIVDGEFRFMYLLDQFSLLYGDEFIKSANELNKKLSSNKTVSKYMKHPAVK